MIRAIDLALAAGVSKTTVSYVFSPQKVHLISAETRERVLKTAKQLGYRPNYLGRSLSMNRSYNIALVFPGRCATNMSVHLLKIFHGITQCAEDSEYNLSVFFGVGRRLLDRLQDHRMDGIIVIGMSSGCELLDCLSSMQLPMVVINRSYHSQGMVSCLYADLGGWCHSEIQRLKGLGCRNLLILNKDSRLEAGRLIEEQAMLETQAQELGDLTLTRMTMEHDLERQCRVLLQKTPHFDGILVNGTGGGAVVAAGAALNLFPGRDFVLSGFHSPVSFASADCDWSYQSHQMGVRGWQILEQMLAGKEYPETEIFPVVPFSALQDNREENDQIFDL